MANNQIIIPTEELRLTAKEFKQASKESKQLVKRLQSAIESLHDQWDSASQQVFYKSYQDWRHHIEGFTVLLDEISKEMLAIAERFEENDKKNN
jgi:WXG100 family type VII secretion target